MSLYYVIFSLKCYYYGSNWTPYFLSP
ncbi:hypothetical protein NQ318_020451 [Aromia moschata]|uniref:Uncharacterized protein n=1 Tax=Aromia moschata TaxID=1265417 RepID=A0AAV8YLS4_9CUCU|nr:hypothetical protein NQ318_020451 [Aromia moschata]